MTNFYGNASGPAEGVDMLVGAADVLVGAVDSSLEQYFANISTSHCRFAVKLMSFDVLLFGFFGTCVNMVGLLGNIVSLMVLIKEHKRSASFAYLIALTATAVVWLFISSWEWNLAFLSRTIKIQHKRLAPYQDYVRESNELANTWVLVAFCFERWQSVSAPLSFHARTKGSHNRRSITVIFLILLLSFAVKIPRLFEYVFVTQRDVCDGDVDGSCSAGGGGGGEGGGHHFNHYNITYVKTEHSAFRDNEVYVWAYKIVFAYATRFFIPLFLLFCFNLRIIAKIRSSAKFRRTSATAGKMRDTGGGGGGGKFMSAVRRRCLSQNGAADASQSGAVGANQNCAAAAGQNGAGGMNEKGCGSEEVTNNILRKHGVTGKTIGAVATPDYADSTYDAATPSHNSSLGTKKSLGTSDIGSPIIGNSGNSGDQSVVSGNSFSVGGFVGVENTFHETPDLSEANESIKTKKVSFCGDKGGGGRGGAGGAAAEHNNKDSYTEAVREEEEGEEEEEKRLDKKNTKFIESKPNLSKTSVSSISQEKEERLKERRVTTSTASLPHTKSRASSSVSNTNGMMSASAGLIKSTEDRVTMICVSTVTAFLVTSFPHFLLSLLRLAEPKFEESDAFQLARKFGIGLTNLNCCLIFVIFFVLSPRYRTVFRRIFYKGIVARCCCCCFCSCCYRRCCPEDFKEGDSWVQSEFSSRRLAEEKKKIWTRTP